MSGNRSLACLGMLVGVCASSWSSLASEPSQTGLDQQGFDELETFSVELIELLLHADDVELEVAETIDSVVEQPSNTQVKNTDVTNVERKR